MKFLRSILIIVLLFITATLLWHGQRKDPPKTDPKINEDSTLTVTDTPPFTRPERRGKLNFVSDFTDLQDPSLNNPLVCERERILYFKSDADYQAFLAAASKNSIKILRRNDRLRALLAGYQQLSDLDGLTNEAEISLNYLVVAPNPSPADAQANAVGFGVRAVDAITGGLDRSGWGAGVKVAVLDTGVANHSVLSQVSTSEIGSFTGEMNGHGTAVASIIAGQHPLTPGVAPEAEILGIRIADSDGRSDSFTLAEGIFAAVDQGAQIINVSMGSYGDSAFVAEAIEYASQRGVVIVASAGNEGLQGLAFPAAYPEVISVGAIDAVGSHLDFSNQSIALSTSAPGFQVNAAWPDEQIISFSGTSASAPFVSGSIAALMSQDKRLSAFQASQLLLTHSNEAGVMGPDAEFGIGTLDLGRAILADTPGIDDPAIASTYYLPPNTGTGNGSTHIIIENRGTSTLGNIPVEVTVNSLTRQYYVNQLQAGEAKLIEIPTDHTRASALGELSIEAKVLTIESTKDLREDNNARSFTLDLKTDQIP